MSRLAGVLVAIAAGYALRWLLEPIPDRGDDPMDAVQPADLGPLAADDRDWLGMQHTTTPDGAPVTIRWTRPMGGM